MRPAYPIFHHTHRLGLVARRAWPLLVALAASNCARTSEGVQLGYSMDALSIQQDPIGTEPPVPLQYNTGNYMSVASDTNSWLMVFEDGGNIRGVLFDDSGVVSNIDHWLPLGSGGNEAYTDVASGAGVYLVMYTDFESSAPGVYAQTVSENGSKISAPTLIGAGGMYPSIVDNGNGFTVTWYDTDIQVARLAIDGSLIPDSTVAVTSTGSANRPQIARLGDTSLIVFEQTVDTTPGVYGVLLDANGELASPNPVLLSDVTTSSNNVCVAAGEDEFLVTWATTETTSRVVGSVVSRTGTVTNREFGISRGSAGTFGCAAAFDGANFLVTWGDQRGEVTAAYGTRVRQDGTTPDGEDTLLASDFLGFQSMDFDLIWSRDRYALVYDSNGIMGRFLEPDLTEMPPGALELTPLPNSQNIPSSVWNGTHYVLAYDDERNPNAYQARGVRIAPSGMLLSGALEFSTPEQQVGNVALASNGSVVLAAWGLWGSENSALASVVSEEGTLSQPVQWQAGGEGMGGLASNGDTFLGLFAAGDNGNGNANAIWGQLFSNSGALSGEPFPIIENFSRPRYGLWRLGSGYVLAYSGQEIEGTVIEGHTVTLSAAGTVIDEYEQPAPGMLTTSAGQNGEQILFSWLDEATSTLQARFFTADAGFGEPFALSESAADGPAAIAWNGSQFISVWSEPRTAMWSRTVSPDGDLSAASQLFQGDYSWQTLTAGEDGQLLLSYVHWLEFSRARRIESRLIGEGVPNPVSTSPVATDSPIQPLPSATETPAATIQAMSDAGSAPDPVMSSVPSSPVSTSSVPQPSSSAEAQPGTDAAAPPPSDAGDVNGGQLQPVATSSGDSGCSMSPSQHPSDSAVWVLLGLCAAGTVRRYRGAVPCIR